MRETELQHDVTEFLAHYGVKGMQWGRRRSRESLAKASSNRSEKNSPDQKATAKQVKKELKADNKWAKKATTMKAQVAVYNKTAELMNKAGLGKTNSDPRFKGKQPLSGNNIPLRQAYLDTVSSTANKYAAKAHKELHGDSPNGRVQVKYSYDSKRGVVANVSSHGKVEHSAAPSGLHVLVKNGYITNIGMAKLPSNQ